MKKRAEEEGRTPKQASVPSKLGLMVNRCNNAALSDLVECGCIDIRGKEVLVKEGPTNQRGPDVESGLRICRHLQKSKILTYKPDVGTRCLVCIL